MLSCIILVTNWIDLVNHLLASLKDYLRDTLDIPIHPHEWEGTLPHFLRHAYRLYSVKLFTTRILLALDKGLEEQTPAVIRKHFRLLQEADGNDREIVYVKEQLSAFNRKRLVEYMIPFIVPGNQMYLASLGIDFREHFRRKQTAPRQLSPSTQALLINLLIQPEAKRHTPQSAAREFKYSSMSMSRAFSEMEVLNLVKVKRAGRERILQLSDSPSRIWKAALPYLRSPVGKRVIIQECDELAGLPKANQSALSEYTMLAPPKRPVYAVEQAKWKVIRQTIDTTSIPRLDPQAVELEIWRYTPRHFLTESLVDPLSLYLSLKDDQEERIAVNLEELLKEVF